MTMTPTVSIDMNRNCSRCSNPGVVVGNPNGLCMDCITATMNADELQSRGIVAKLPEHIKAQLIQYGEDEDVYWVKTARLLEQMFEDAKAEGLRLPKMLMYQQAAACVKQKDSTVRNWAGVYKKVGDALLDEHDGVFGFAHWRAIIPAAKKANKTIEDFAAELAATSDDYGGLPIPVSVIIARTNNEEKTEAELFLEELDDVRKTLALLSKHVNFYAKHLRGDVLGLASAAEALNERVEKIEERRAKESRKEN